LIATQFFTNGSVNTAAEKFM